MTDNRDFDGFEFPEILDDIANALTHPDDFEGAVPEMPVFSRYSEPSKSFGWGNVGDWRRAGRRPKPGTAPIARFGWGQSARFRNLFALPETEEIPLISAEDAASQGLKTAKEWNRQGLKIRGGAHPFARIPNKRKKGGAEMVYLRDSTVRFRDPEGYELTADDLAAMATAK